MTEEKCDGRDVGEGSRVSDPWPLDHEVLTSLATEGRYFDDLDDRLGPVGSRARLLSLEADARWEARYHKFCDRDGPVAVVPVYRRQAKEWSGPLYTPDFPGQLDSPVPPQQCAVIGGRDGMVSSLHVRMDMRRPGVYRSILEVITKTYSECASHLYFPHFYIDELDLISATLDRPPLRKLTGADARLDGLFGDWDDTLTSKPRSTLRKDVADSARLGIQTSVRSWDEVASYAAPLIADHYMAKGGPEHSVLVDRRVREFERCPEFSVVVFIAQAQDVQGVVVGVIWREWMDLIEIGLSQGCGDVRRSIYAQLLAHLPSALGKSMGLRKLRAGPTARMPKAARGAVFYDLESAVAATAEAAL